MAALDSSPPLETLHSICYDDSESYEGAEVSPNDGRVQFTLTLDDADRVISALEWANDPRVSPESEALAFDTLCLRLRKLVATAEQRKA